ncbi:hypothetical protein MJO28_005258 [Puccinia striiformis f. sp. tritici]|uniref:Uncharacterized protein n=1 Tax=Puccinia striiformis f. sp. tritici TaxID=168172 RepID=A0ACC0EJR5_9BASI|nr:hypothetical protein MJO28_005258 [Puccinia striiformis f. sp. tritici]
MQYSASSTYQGLWVTISNSPVHFP